jgi:hypothetical protein
MSELPAPAAQVQQVNFFLLSAAGAHHSRTSGQFVVHELR